MICAFAVFPFTPDAGHFLQTRKYVRKRKKKDHMVSFCASRPTAKKTNKSTMLLDYLALSASRCLSSHGAKRHPHSNMTASHPPLPSLSRVWFGQQSRRGRASLSYQPQTGAGLSLFQRNPLPPPCPPPPKKIKTTPVLHLQIN